MTEQLGDGAQGAPRIISRDAKVCRRSCQVKSSISAIASAAWKPFLMSCTGSPAFGPDLCGNTYGLSGVFASSSAFSVFRAVALTEPVNDIETRWATELESR